jgi:hypothetical protein
MRFNATAAACVGCGAGELDGEDAVVLAEVVGFDEFVAEDCARCGGCEEVVDFVAEFGGDSLEGVVMGRRCCSL